MTSRYLASETLRDLASVDRLLAVTAPTFDDKRDSWSCEVTVEPDFIDKRIYGASALQALFLSLEMIGYEISRQTDRGVFERADVPFGKALRPH